MALAGSPGPCHKPAGLGHAIRLGPVPCHTCSFDVFAYTHIMCVTPISTFRRRSTRSLIRRRHSRLLRTCRTGGTKLNRAGKVLRKIGNTGQSDVAWKL